MRKLPAFSDQQAKKILGELCRRHSLDPNLVLQLAEVHARYSGSGRAQGVFAELDVVLNDYVSSLSDSEAERAVN